MSVESVEASEPVAERPSRRMGIPIALAALIAALVVWYVWSGQNAEREQAAVKSLQELGALVVMDGDGRHAASVNLSTVQTPEALAKAIEHLSALGGLMSLDASRTGIRDEQLAAIGELSSLNTLTLNETAISDDGVRRLAGLGNLESLFLASTPLSDAGLTHLESFDALRILDLSDTKVTADLSPLNSLEQLEWLVMRDLTLAEGALATLDGLKGLKRLSLTGSDYTPAAAASLKRTLPGLAVDR